MSPWRKKMNMFFLVLFCTVSTGVNISTMVILSKSYELYCRTFYDISQIFGETDQSLQSLLPNQYFNRLVKHGSDPKYRFIPTFTIYLFDLKVVWIPCCFSISFDMQILWVCYIIINMVNNWQTLINIFCHFPGLFFYFIHHFGNSLDNN